MQRIFQIEAENINLSGKLRFFLVMYLRNMIFSKMREKKFLELIVKKA
jgi:hypothetical protein